MRIFDYLRNNSLNDYIFNQFRDIKFIKKGGFGRIYSAVSKMDLRTYAIKKITIKCESLHREMDCDVFNELQLLSQLDHKNIARYHTSWIAADDYTDYENDSSESNSSSSNNINTGESGGTSSENHENPNLEQSSNNYEEFFLYIQMELYEITLNYALMKRNEQHWIMPPSHMQCDREFSHQLLEGVEYIHAQHIMHRDLKPDNIFLKKYGENNWQLKIGDFGLSRHFHYEIGEENGNLPTSNFSANVGTPLYSAPELSSIHQNTNYSHKCDLYSVGVVLLELMVKFTTFSELCHVVTKIQNGIITNELEKMWPLEAPFVVRLLSIDPENRPEARYLLKETRCFREEFN